MKTLIRRISANCLLFAILNLSCYAREIKPLKIGDKVPDIPFQLIDSKTELISYGRLNDFKGKLVILDFWASWCNSCIRSFPKMDKFQIQYSEKVKMIMVNSKMFGGLNPLDFLKKRKKEGLWDFSLMLAANDSIAFQLFPSYSIPHYAWISSAGRVIGITDEVTQEKIEEVLSGKDIDWPVKKDFFPNKIEIPQIEINDDLLSFSFLKKGKLEDDVDENRPMREYLYSIKGDEKEYRGLVLKNLPLVELYKYAFRGMYQSRSRVILDVKNPSLLDYGYKFLAGLQYPEYITSDENMYTYQIVVPAGEEETKTFSYMLNDLNTKSGYVGKIEKRRISCLGIEPINKGEVQGITNNPRSKTKIQGNSTDKNVFHFKDAQSFAFALNEYWVLDKWVQVDDLSSINQLLKSKYGDCDFSLGINKNGQSQMEIENQLKRYGLHFVQREIEMEMLVITDQKL